MIKPTKELAKTIAAKAYPLQDWEKIRDIADQYTGGELDCFQLDMLTDWSRKYVKSLHGFARS